MSNKIRENGFILLLHYVSNGPRKINRAQSPNDTLFLFCLGK